MESESLLESKPWLYGFADQFTKDFSEIFAKHYAKAYDSAWAETLSTEIINTRINTQREIASSLLENTNLTHEEIALCCELDEQDIDELAKEK